MSVREEYFDRLTELAGKMGSITDLFKTEPDRISEFVMQVGPLRADFSKQAISTHTRSALIDMATGCGLEAWRERLFAGDPVNSSENRAVLHMALRGVGGSRSVQKQVKNMRKKMADFADEVRAKGKFKAVVHIGIGGSDLGPRLVADAFAATQTAGMDLRFAENIDGASINDALEGLNPKTTLVVVVSKSFTTQETRTNAESAREWLRAALGKTSGGHFIAVTANRKGAEDFDIPSDQITGSGGVTLCGQPSACLYSWHMARKLLTHFLKGLRKWISISGICLWKKTCRLCWR